jgi:hypothetical protein
MKQLFKTLILITIQSTFFSCSSVTDSSDNVNYLSYFPIGDNYSWKYKITYGGNAEVDTVTYSMKFDLVGETIYYSLYLDNRAVGLYSVTGDTVFSHYNPYTTDTTKFVIWKKKLKINETFKSYQVNFPGPGYAYQISHKVVGLNSKIKINDISYNSCVEIERSYADIAGFAEKCFYADGIGLVYIEGTSQLLGTDGTYKYELLEFSK